MPRIKTLKPRIGLLNTSRLTEAQRIGSTDRTRGGKWMRTRAKWLRANPLCCMCHDEGRVTAADEVDHIAPLWAGGADNDSNYQSLCKAHHAAKTAAEAGDRARA